MTLKACLDCGELSAAVRCPDCVPPTTQLTARQRGYDTAWDKLSKRAREIQPWCSDCGTRYDLTADHLRWPARTLNDVCVVCLPCNIARGPARGPRGRGVTKPPPGPPVLAKFRSHTPGGYA